MSRVYSGLENISFIVDVIELEKFVMIRQIEEKDTKGGVIIPKTMQIQGGNILKSSFWPEEVRVLSAKIIGKSQIKVEAVGLETHRFYNPILSEADIKSIEILEEKPILFSADGESLFLYLESHRIRNAFQFDPLYAVTVSMINPLPHQIDAVYHHILLNPRIRFLLADDPGAGKTIMAGLLLKELKYRGLVERTLVVGPGHLKDQWLREMKERFHEHFSIIDRNVMAVEWGKNVFNERNQVILSMDFAKQEDVMFALKDSKWDLCIVDEAHKMSAYNYGEKISKTQRYTLGELLSPITSYLLFLTATPHRGDPENFRLLLDLLVPGFFADTNNGFNRSRWRGYKPPEKMLDYGELRHSVEPESFGAANG